jgi:hypothetical protein
MLTKQLKASLETNLILIKKLGDNKSNTPNTPVANTCQPFDQKAWEVNLDLSGYCWSHGYQVQKGHNSTNCKGKLGGHNNDATREDMKGGSTKGKE